jgi:5-methyltetrahydrofolate--homocysteine methyltransferase
MGPSGELMAPHGTLTKESAEAAFSEQATALAQGGVDVLWIESIFAFDELAAAVAAAASTGLPVASTMTFDTAGRTMMGNSPEQASEFIHAITPPLVAYGANCGAGPAMLVDTICEFSRSAREGDVIIAKGNCGIPKTLNGQVVYSGDDATMARYARLARDAGARIIGGCCGTSPARLRAIADALDGYTPGGIPDAAAIEAALGPITRSKRRTRRRRARTG